MKTNLLLLLGILLMGCQTPEKLYQQGQAQAAYAKLISKSKFGNLNEEHKDLLLKIHSEKVTEDIAIIEDWSNQNNPELWPRIKGRLDRIEADQHAVTKISLLQDIPLAQIRTFPNLQNKLSEAAHKAADYYYNRQQQAYELAKQGDKLAARRGFDLGEKAMAYVADYKNVQSTNEALKVIGTDYVLVYPEYQNEDPYLVDCMQYFENHWKLPLTQKWSTISFEQSSIPRVDYWLRVSPADLFISGPQWSSYSCTNSKEIEVGTKTIEEWSEQDSAYVQKQVPIYEVVTVSVTNHIQYREAGVNFQVDLIENGKESSLAKSNFDVVHRWQNTFGESYGDSRAIDSSCCPDIGFEQRFPGDRAMLKPMGLKSKNRVQQFLAKHLGTYQVPRKKGLNIFNLWGS